MDVPGISGRMCPDRWSRNKGSPKGSPKGGKAYFTAYDEYGFYVPTEEINVLSTHDCMELQSIGSTKVVLDTGATESVAGVASAARLQDESGLTYRICLSDRPRFRFGNGQSQQAVSKITFQTPALEEVSFYLLDGAAENTPLLLGARDLRERQALIAYKGEYLAHRDSVGRWRVNRLTSLQSGHLALSLTTYSMSLTSAMQPPHQPPRDREDDEEDDSRDDDQHGGEGRRRREHDGDGGRKRTRSDGRGESEPGIRQPAVLQAAVRMTTSGRFGHDQIVDFYGTAAVNDGNDDDGYTPGTAVTTPAEAPVHSTTMLSPQQEPEPLEEPAAEERGRDRRLFSAGWMGSRSVTERSGENEGAEFQSAVAIPRTEEEDVEAEIEVLDTETGVWGPPPNRESGTGVGSIMMVVRADDDMSLGDRLSNLAQRLQALRSSVTPRDERQAMCTMPSSRSPSRRMALRGTSHSWTAEEEQICKLAQLQEMRPEAVLHGQVGIPGRDKSLGTGATHCGCCARRAEDDLQHCGDEREDHDGQADGDPRPRTCAEWRTRQDGSEHPSRRASGEVPDGDGEQGHHVQGDSNYDDTKPKDTEHGNSKSGDTTGRDYNDPKDIAHEDLYGKPCEDREQGEEGANGVYGISIDSSTSTYDQPGGDRDWGGRRSHGDLGRAGGESRMSALWTALKSLRSKMQLGQESQSSQDADGNQSYNLHYDNTDNLTMKQKCTTTTTTTRTTDDSSPVDSKCFNVATTANVTKKMVRPVLAKRLAKAAALTTVLMQPVKELFSAVSNQVDVVEVACSPTSELTSTFEDAGYKCLRVNYRNGFDLDTRKGTKKLCETLDEKKPKLTWVSMACTRLTSLQNLTPRTPEQWDKATRTRSTPLRGDCGWPRRHSCSRRRLCMGVACWSTRWMEEPSH